MEGNCGYGDGYSIIRIVTMKARVKYRPKQDNFIIQEKIYFFFWVDSADFTPGSKLYHYLGDYHYNTEEEAKGTLLKALVSYQKDQDKIQLKKKKHKNEVIDSNNIKQIAPEEFL